MTPDRMPAFLAMGRHLYGPDFMSNAGNYENIDPNIDPNDLVPLPPITAADTMVYHASSPAVST
jgi:hypothetical protein